MMNNSYNPATNLKQLNIISQQQQQHQQHSQPHTHNVAETAATNLLQSSPPTAASISYLQQQLHPLQQQLAQFTPQQQQQLAAMGATHSAAAIFHDPRQLQALSGLDKTYYNGGAANTAAAGRYYTTTAAATNAAASTHPNTILITNNYTQQPQTTAQQQRATISGVTTTMPNSFNNTSNIRIVSAAAANALQQPQHIFNINSNSIGKEHSSQQQLATTTELLQLQQLPPVAQQQVYQQQQQQQLHLQHHPHYAQQQQLLLPQHQAAIAAQPHYLQQHYAQQQHAPMPMQQFYAPQVAEEVNAAASATTNTKILPTIVATSATTVAAAPLPLAPTAATNSTTSSTVVLDRINICINNHYTDAGANIAASPASVASSSLSLSATPSQQPSPIIPAIQHKAVVDSVSGLLIDPYASNESSSTIIIDEPDSTTTTTTPHTPPTTPENLSPPPAMSLSSHTATTTMTMVQSPSTTTTITTPKNCFLATTVDNSNLCATFEPLEKQTLHATQLLQASNDTASATQQQHQSPMLMVPLTPPTPPTPPPLNVLSPPSPPTASLSLHCSAMAAFNVGEDVLIKRSDGRFYLGTIITVARQQFLVRFDDQSELWSAAEEMRKLGGGDTTSKGRMCVACKRSDGASIVETCERCGRGYHRNCTVETSLGSSDWMCKRCAKPMKMVKKSISLDKKLSVCRQLPYDVDSLNWDDKHRVNEEQIYCYCGKSGKFDHNMLQCCRCINWFHTDCMLCFKNTILRGDGFFVFCCSVCNNGQEFLRRLQLNWVDFLHLTLYNLSATRKHQNQKYHHLIKDIWPFALEKRSSMPIPKAWVELSEEDFKEKIKRTLKENSDRFMSGREIKKDHFYYALRHNGPPILPKINIKPEDVLNNALLTDTLKLTLLKGALENESNTLETILINDDDTASEVSTSKPVLDQDQDVSMLNDVYEFRDEDEKFTSDDEIPIKHIMEKSKLHKTALPITSITNAVQPKQKTPTCIEKMDIYGSNDASNILPHKTPQKHEKTFVKKENSGDSSLMDSNSSNNIKKIAESKTNVPPTKNSRKRKAFTVSKSYKETEVEADSRICDSSSDENSSSSRGTSLDLIIPPPKNFLGLNNPFRMVTPKKTSAGTSTGKGNKSGDKKSVSFARRGTNVKNSIFTTTSFDFSAKLAALKSTGIFSNLSSSVLAKAAGQQRLVRTIKRRLSAKDITIGPNQEVRRRRIRRLSSNVEVISTTTINPIPSNFFPIHAKDLISSTTTATNHKLSTSTTNNNNHNTITSSTTTSTASLSSIDSASAPLSITATASTAIAPQPTHGRRLRQRPEKSSPNNSRRSSISGASTTSSSSILSAGAVAVPVASQTGSNTMHDLKQSVNKYFGAVNRIESGEKFSIRAKRQLANGQKQYLIEWGDVVTTT